jgi:hypothetical protein
VLDLLRNYLNGAVHPDLVNEFVKADKVFQTFSLQETDYDDIYTDILMTIDQKDAHDTTAELISITSEMLVSIMKQHSITVADNLPLGKLVLLAQSIWAMQNYDTPSTLLAIVYQHEPPEDLFSELVEATIGVSAELAMTWIVKVDIAFINAVREYANEQEAAILNMDEGEAPTQYAENMRRFLRLLKDPPLRIVDAIRRGMKVGFPFKIYADAVLRDAESLEINQIANELIGMALISSDGSVDIRATINKHLEEYVHNTDTIVRVQSVISTTLLEYGRYEQA